MKTPRYALPFVSVLTALILASAPAARALPKVKVLATGGTIAGAQATQADAGYKSGTFSVDWNVVMAGAVVAALPTAIIYILLGRFFIRGILAGSVKG